MGHDQTTPVSVDPESLKQAQGIWHNFTGMIKYGVIANVILLLLMAYFLT